MACRDFFECVLKLLNLLVVTVGLAMAGYRAYLLVLWLRASELVTPSRTVTLSSGIGCLAVAFGAEARAQQGGGGKPAAPPRVATGAVCPVVVSGLVYGTTVEPHTRRLLPLASMARQ